MGWIDLYHSVPGSMAVLILFPLKHETVVTRTNHVFQLKKKIHGTEISWALGAMLSLLDQRDESHPATGG